MLKKALLRTSAADNSDQGEPQSVRLQKIGLRVPQNCKRMKE
jgi:hypothetical protein